MPKLTTPTPPLMHPVPHPLSTGRLTSIGLLGLIVSLSACGGSDPGPRVAVGATPASSCSAASFSYSNLTITSVKLVAAGSTEAAGSSGLTVTNPEYCDVVGTLNARTGPIDGRPYGIGFEMRLPTQWNGRFFYQPNGGLDGSVVAAVGDILGGGQASTGLTKGFATLSTDAGHQPDTTVNANINGGVFGIDPQARLDYGYNAVGSLTPMAKTLIKQYFGKQPDRSYIVGTSNGGRHAMVAASRFGDQFDGFVAGSPGFNLPKAAVAQLWGANQLATISSKFSSGAKAGLPDVSTSFSVSRDLKLVSNAIIAKCDSLDGVADQSVNDIQACQAAFNISTDVPTCTGTPDGTCLSAGQKTVLANMHAGAKNSTGQALYAQFLWDAGIYNTSSSGWFTWKTANATGPRDPLSVGFVFTTPPTSPSVMTGVDPTILNFVFGFNFDTDAPKIFASNSTYTESAMSFMTPPDLLMSKMVGHGGKMILVQGSSDPVFSVQDTINWYNNFRTGWNDQAQTSARLFIVPGMGHSRGGPATDNYDMVDAIVNWVEYGKAPDSVLATARGVGGTITSTNADVPASWSPNRTRPLCPYPKVARYNGSGNVESAANFSCR